MRSSTYALAIALVIANGCISPFPWEPDPSLRRPGSPPPSQPPSVSADSGSAVPRVQRKVVNGKREPNTLLALDGTSCVVTEKKFRESDYGEKVWCLWR